LKGFLFPGGIGTVQENERRGGKMNICFRCRKEVAIDGPPGHKDVCPFCSEDLRCCLNCAFYSACRERVLEKGRSNFCDYFHFKESATDSGRTNAGNAPDKLEMLFNKP
jgi:hypothetical protein